MLYTDYFPSSSQLSYEEGTIISLIQMKTETHRKVMSATQGGGVRSLTQGFPYESLHSTATTPARDPMRIIPPITHCTHSFGLQHLAEFLSRADAMLT